MNAQEARKLDGDISDARARFRAALVHTQSMRSGVADVEAAAGQFCQLMRAGGRSPERTLIEAKAVIEETIDGHNASLAERAVTRCIEHYFRAE